MKNNTLLLTAILFLVVFSSPVLAKETKNGFIVDNGLISSNEILFGGPPRDGIPALSHPEFISAGDVTFMSDNDRILGLVMDGVASRAYPIAILNYHEVINDTIDGKKVVITFCPLCGTGVAFASRVNNQDLEFGVSGLLYNSDVLLYDRETESLWSQILGQAVTGRLKGTSLDRYPVSHTSWKRWQEQYPQTMVLSRNTGFTRDYTRNPYESYATSERLYFPVANVSESSIHPKETVLGVIAGQKAKAYPFSVLTKYGRESFNDQIGDTTVTIFWDAQGLSARATGSGQVALEYIQGFWFAWYAFHPQTEVFSLP